MASVETHYVGNITSYANFKYGVANIISSNNFAIVDTSIYPGAYYDINRNRISFMESGQTAASVKFPNFNAGRSDNYDTCLIISSAVNSGSYFIHCLVTTGNFSGGNTAFYNDTNKPYTDIIFSDSSVSALYPSFRIMKYFDGRTRFLSLGKPGNFITLGTYLFKSIDDPTVTKYVLIVTDTDGYVSYYDKYNTSPWYVENNYHSGSSIGTMYSINAYKLTIKGYYCDDLYYFDGGFSPPGEGICVVDGHKFFKIGHSNIFLKLDNE